MPSWVWHHAVLYSTLLVSCNAAIRVNSGELSGMRSGNIMLTSAHLPYLPGHAFNITELQEPRRKRQDVFLVVSVTSAALSGLRRQFQRTQWLKSLRLLEAQVGPSGDARSKVIFAFVVGNHLAPHVHESLMAEHRSHGDILFLDVPDFDETPWQEIGADGTSATTLKVLGSARWARHFFTAKYFLRLGDDSYFRPEKLYASYTSGLLPSHLAIFGFVVHNHPYMTPAGNIAHPYLSGMGFCMTADALEYIADLNMKNLLVGGPEDEVVLSWFLGTKFRILHDAGFRDADQLCANSNDDLVVHCLRDELAWSSIQADGLLPCTETTLPCT